MKQQRYCLRMMLTTLPLFLVILLELGARAAAMDQFSERDLENYYKRMYDFGLGKRAYTYSANKRPMYDFGIGKRDGNRQRMYAFGLGKRAAGSDVDEDFDEEMRDDYAKRYKPYEFGLGKRLAPSPYSFGLGKRGGSSQGKLYSFGLGKRQATAYPEEEEDYDQGQQADKRSRYQFGLGKRGAFSDRYEGSNERSLRSQRYNFGLGKRDLGEDFDDVTGGEDLGQQHHDIMGRSMKYGFGLGKREVTKEALEDLESTLFSPGAISSALLLNPKNQHTSNTRKREVPLNNIKNNNNNEASLTSSRTGGDKPEIQQRR